jgi:hypothetical protein|tara:strand:- start:41280 stop:42011 length:732 start_codon:yes stop_codon:yes gene_type:complete
MNKLNSLIVGLLSVPSFVLAQATDDNEIKITQQGDTLALYVDQIGFGNKIGGDDFTQGTATAMSITGSNLVFDMDFIGNQNVLFGPVVSNNSVYTLTYTGDLNTIDWDIGNIGSSDDSDINFNVSGDNNTFDLDQANTTTAERLDADLVLIGSYNVFDSDWESSDNVWTLDVTGSSNNINTLQNDGSHTLDFTLEGDGSDVDINQISGTCPITGMSCNGVITLDITSDNAIIQLNQKDSGSDI